MPSLGEDLYPSVCDWRPIPIRTIFESIPMRLLHLLIPAACLLSSHLLQGEIYTVKSPSGNVAVEVMTVPDLMWRVEANGEIVIGESPIRVELGDGVVLGRHTVCESVHPHTINQEWESVVPGRRSKIQDHCNETFFRMVEMNREPGVKVVYYDLVVRAYDDGVAIRYRIPKQRDYKVHVMEESIGFVFPDESQAWVVDYKGFESHQEEPFAKQSLRSISDAAYVGLPLVVEGEHAMLAITEAALVDYAGMYLRQATGDRKDGAMLRTCLAKRPDQINAVVAESNLVSPWRAIMIGREPSDFLSNDLVLNLNEPCAIEDTSWIQPGLVAWDHWWSGEVKMDTETIKRYISFAAEMGWPYQLVDWQWYGSYNRPGSDVSEVHPAVDMDEVRRFAAEKGVRLWLWLYWTDVERSDFVMLCAKFKEWGIAGIKIDFMAREDQWMVNWYHRIIKTAAANNLMVDFHGAYKPTGFRRTYPNLMTREGVLGNEYNKWSDKVTPAHNCTLVYTRGLLGEMDYTPGGFLNRNPEDFRIALHQPEPIPTEVQGTRAHQLALFVVFESPIMVVCEHPDHIIGQSGEDFLRVVPTVWDETIGLAGEIGSYAVVAKRSGTDWFVGAITNQEARVLEIPLGFLEAGNWIAEIWADGPDAPLDASDLIKDKVTLDSSGSIELNLASGGGAVVRLIPAE